ncbi:MAG: imidazole glycerol phosphate synthase subunit HisF [Limnochordia bacterium]|jgi:cyclase
MSVKRVIPCLDVKEGRVVKGTRFLGLRDAGDPVELARLYDESGADELIFLDITASVERRRFMVDLANRVREAIAIPFVFGGGIRSLEDMDKLLAAGVDKVSLGTAAVEDPKLISQGARAYGRESIVVAVDAKRAGQGWEVHTRGGRTPTGLDVVAWARRVEAAGAGEILLTSMDADGTKEGYDNELNKAVASAVGIPVIASGGAGKLEHFRDAFLVGGVDAVLAASLFHYGEYSIGQVKEYLAQEGIPVRMAE